MYSAYGLQKNDSMSMEEIPTKHSETLNFLEIDVCGNLQVKDEFGSCSKCGQPLSGEIVYLHGNRKLCKSCEVKQRQKIRRNKLTTKKAEKK